MHVRERGATGGSGISFEELVERDYNEGDFEEEDEWEEEEDEGEWDAGDADVERTLAESAQELSTGSLVLPPGRQAPRVKSAVFVKSSSSVAQCPKDTKIPEFAVIGRSNVGKSSLINMLTNHKGLAQTSKKPGKTQLINHFLINDSWYLVDLPGYGYAVAPNAIRTEWNAFTKAYFTSRTNLLTVLLLVDATIPPQAIDVECADWLGRNKIPLTVVFTKCDRQKKARRNGVDPSLCLLPHPRLLSLQIPLTVVFTKCDRQKKARRKGRPPAVNAALFRAELAECYAELPPWVMTSAVTSEGKDALLSHIAQLRDTSGMGLVLGGRGLVVLTGHSDASWDDNQLRLLTYLLSDLAERPRSPPVLYVDNKAMLALCHEQRLEHRTKHIALRYFLARELQQRRPLRLSYVASRANTADVFTKALESGDHQRFCTALGLVPTLPYLLVA
ncbi:unnamed protein product [Closterium sp. NIES-54]